MDVAVEASIFNRPAFLTGSKHLFFASPIRQILKLSTKLPTTTILRCNSRASINCSLFNSRFSGKEVFVNGVRLSSVIVKCSGAKAQNGGYKLGISEVLVKKGLILAAIVCGVVVFRCRRVTAVEGFMSAGGVEVLEQSGLLLRSWWPKVLQVLRVFKDQGLLLVVLFGLSAFFSMAETAITTLWPWKVRELAEKESENGVFKMLRSDVTRFLTTILIGTTVANIAATALVTDAATTIFGEAGVSAATGVMTVAVLLFTEITPKSIAVHNATEVCEPYVTEDELKLMLRGAELSGAIEEEEQDMIENVLEIKDTCVREVMTPLVDVVAIDASATLVDFHSLWVTHQCSRVPVFEHRVDNIVGVTYAMDLLDYVQKFAEICYFDF